MSYRNFYRYIIKQGDEYWIMKNNEKYLSCPTLEEALFERDRLMAVDWDWELFCELPSTINGYIHIKLPPFEHKARYITIDREHWVVRAKGRKYRYYGQYYDYDEAKKVAMIYRARINHYPTRYRVQRRINGKTKTYGYYSTIEEAEDRVQELIENEWET